MTGSLPLVRHMSSPLRPSPLRPLPRHLLRRSIFSLVSTFRDKATTLALGNVVHTLRPGQTLAITRMVGFRTFATLPATTPTGSTGLTSSSASDRLHTGRDPIQFPNQQQKNKSLLYASLAIGAAIVAYTRWHPDRVALMSFSGEENANMRDTLDSVLGTVNSENRTDAASTPEEIERTKHTKIERKLTPEAVTRILRANEKSVILAQGFQEQSGGVSGGRPIWRYDINAVASNNPIEDDHSEHVLTGGGRDQMLFGVFDGHSGWNCSQKVARELGVYATKSLEKFVGPEAAATAAADLNAEAKRIARVTEALQTAFVELDSEIVERSVERILSNANSSRTQATQSLLPALAGSCALLAYVDYDDLFVACTGDSRAVLGTRDEKTGTWTAVPMSVDQTGRNTSEMERLKKEHPGEEESVVMRGRVLGGLEPTRAFGDARYKWSQEVQDKIFDSYFPGRRSMPRYFVSPPYVTAKPEVIHRKLSRNDRFLVMATDGLWDKLTNEEVVALVGGYLDVIEKEADAEVAADFPVSESDNASSSFTPHKPSSTLSKREFTFRDNNVSTHLIRNALGGASDDKLCSIMSIPAPMCRSFRDDITVTVLFFGEAETKLIGVAGIGEAMKGKEAKNSGEAKKGEEAKEVKSEEVRNEKVLR